VTVAPVSALKLQYTCDSQVQLQNVGKNGKGIDCKDKEDHPLSTMFMFTVDYVQSAADR